MSIHGSHENANVGYNKTGRGIQCFGKWNKGRGNRKWFSLHVSFSIFNTIVFESSDI
jgi:hypothetical protein